MSWGHPKPETSGCFGNCWLAIPVPIKQIIKKIQKVASDLTQRIVKLYIDCPWKFMINDCLSPPDFRGVAFSPSNHIFNNYSLSMRRVLIAHYDAHIQQA